MKIHYPNKVKCKWCYLSILILVILLGCVGCSQKSEETNKYVPFQVQEKDFNADVHLNYYDISVTEIEADDFIIPVNHTMLHYDGITYFSSRVPGMNGVYKIDKGSTIPFISFDMDTFLSFAIDNEGRFVCLVKEDNNTQALEWYDGDGTIIKRQEIMITTSFDAQKMVIDEAGDIIILNNGILKIIDSERKNITELVAPINQINDIGKSSSGEIYVTYFVGMMEQAVIARLDTKSKQLGIAFDLPGNGFLYSAPEEHFWTVDSRYLYDFDSASGKKVVLADLLKHGIDACSINNISADSLDLFLITECSNDYLENHSTVIRNITMSRIEAPNWDKEIVRLVHIGSSEDPSLLKFIMEFNRVSDKYEIQMQAFDLLNDEEISNRLNALMVSQDCPDIILTNHYYYQWYAPTMIFEDIEPLLSASLQYSKDDFLKNTIEAMYVDDKLFGVPASFQLKTIATPEKSLRSLVGRKNAWRNESLFTGISIDDFLTFLENNPNAKIAGQGEPINILMLLLQFGIEDFLDYDSRQCFFDDSFVALLERVNKLGSTHISSVMEAEVMLTDDTLFGIHSLRNFFSLSQLDIQYGKEMSYIGYPTLDGEECRCVLYPNYITAILKKSNCKEGAWEFIEYFLTYYDATDEFPSLKCKFNDLFKKVTTPTFIEKEGKKEESPVSYYYSFADNTSVPIYSLTTKQQEKIMGLINHSIHTRMEERVINQIIQEEVPAYFGGQKSARTVTEIIQNRVQIYLDER